MIPWWIPVEPGYGGPSFVVVGEMLYLADPASQVTSSNSAWTTCMLSESGM